MSISYKQIALLLWSTLACSLPVWAREEASLESDKEEQVREEQTYNHKLVVTADTGGKGGAEYKVQVPRAEGKTLKYGIKLGKAPMGTIWQVAQDNDSKGKGWANKLDFNIDNTLAYAKGIFKTMYMEYVDETGTQSLEIGIVSNDGQVVGAQLKTPDFDVTIDLEGVARLIAKQMGWQHLSVLKGKAAGPQEAFKKSTSGLGAIKLKWELENDATLTCGVRFAKGDFAQAGESGGFDIGTYITGISATYKMEEPFLDFIHKFKGSYTRFTPKRNKKGKLTVKPGLHLSVDLGKIELFDEEPNVSLGIGYYLCDIGGRYSSISDIKEQPTHFSVDIQAKFKNPYKIKGLTVTPKVSVQVTNQNLNNAWLSGQTMEDAIKDYTKSKASVSVGFRFETLIGDEYYVL